MTFIQWRQIQNRARDLAYTGKYHDFDAIVVALVAKGYKDAPQLLKGTAFKARLNCLCREARAVDSPGSHWSAIGAPIAPSRSRP